MIWLLFALLTALSVSLMDVFSKKSLKDIDEYVVAFSLRFFALIFLLPLLFFIEIPKIGDQFWVALVVNGLLNVVAWILYMKAIKHSDLSLSMPFVTFTPLFLLITSPLIVQEFPSRLGVLGIILIVLGAYFMKIKERHQGWLAPFKALLKEKGPRFMLIVAFIWSITSNFDKVGVLESSPLFWSIAVNVFIGAVMLPVMLYKSGKKVSLIGTKWKSLLPVGFFNASMISLQMMAISMALVSYVISIKRTSAIFAVIFGFLIFKEKGIKERLLGAVVMVIGVVLITLS